MKVIATIVGWCVLAAAVAATPARAAWYQASTRHFIVYADTSAAGAQRSADELESLDAALRFYQNMPDHDAVAANKLTVFVVPTLEEVRRLCGPGCSNVGGFYNGRASGSVAFTPRRAGDGSKTDWSPRIVLFHEYGHHFLLGNYVQAFPAWLSEGYAEFVSTTRVSDDAVTLGAPALHRAWDLLDLSQIPLERLFEPPAKRRPDEIAQLYSRGWLLTHYLLLSPGGLAKLNAYVTAFNAGVPSVEAARRAFGDLKALDAALNRYVMAPRMTVLKLHKAKLPTTPATVRALTPGEAAMIRLRMASTRGVDTRDAAKVLAEARPIAQRFPDDAAVQGWFAEMAYDADDLAAAAAAADRALAVDPASAQALLYRSLVLRDRAVAAGAFDAATWTAVRRPLIAANRLSPDNAAVLEAFYESYGAQRAPISDGARRGLLRAQELVPQDTSLRYRATRQLLIDGDLEAARAMFRPLAYDPHGGSRGRDTLRALDAASDAKTALARMQPAGDATDDPAK